MDEPSVGLHPLDVRVLLTVLQRLVDNGATVVSTGTPEQVARNTDSVTGRYLSGLLT